MHKPNGSLRKVFAAGLAVTTAFWAIGLVAFVPVALAVEAHPVGTLVNSGGTIWQVTSNGRVGFDSAAKFHSHRFDFADVVPANSADLALANQGLAAWGDGVLFNDGGTVYQVSGGQKHGFVSAGVFTGLGFSFSNVEVGSLSGVPAGANIDNISGAHLPGTFVNEGGTVFMVTSTGRMGLPQPGVLFSHGAGFEDVVVANTADQALANVGNATFRDGTLVNDGGTVWAVGAGAKRGFPSASCFTGFGFSFNSVIVGSTAGISAGANLCAATDDDVTPPTDSTGTLTVSLASDTPSSQLVPISAQRVGFTKVNLTATGGDVTVDSWVVERTGVATDSVFTGLELVDLTTNATLNENAKTLSSDHRATFTEDLTISNGQTRSVMLAGNIATSGHSGEEPRLSLVSVAVKGSAQVTGGFPLTGNSMTINATITIGTATIQRGAYSNSSNTALEVGREDFTVLAFQIQAGSEEDLTFDQVKVRQQGSASLTADLGDITLLQDGTELAEAQVIDSKNLSFKFSAITILKGQTKQFQVKVDVVSGSARTINFDIWRTNDVHLVGTTFGFAIAPSYTGAGSGASAGPVLSDNSHTISAGTLRVARSSTVGAENITVGTDQVLGAFEFEVKGEAVVITALTLTVASSTANTVADPLRTVKLVDANGITVAGPTDVTNNALTVAWTDTFTIPTGTSHYRVLGTLATNGQWASDDTLTVSIRTPATAITARGDVTGDTITASPASAITASQQTVKAASLTVTKNSIPTDKTVVVNSTGVLAGSWSFDATNSGEDIRITAIAVRASTTSKFSNLTLKSAGVTLDTNDNPATANDASATSTFTLSDPLLVMKGTSQVIDLFVDIPSSSDAGEIDSYGITTATAITALGNITGNDASVTVVANDGALLTVAGAGTLTVNLDATAPAIRQVVHGSTGVVLSAINLKATNEPVRITQINLRVADGGVVGQTGTFAQVSKVFLHLNGVVVGNSSGYTLGQANTQINLSVGDLTIPESQDGDILSLVGDMVSFGTNLPGVENADIAVGLNGANGFTATGQGSNSAATVTYNDSTGSAIILHKAIPSVVTETVSNQTLVSGATLHRSKVSAVGGTVGVQRMTYTVATTSGSVTGVILKLVSCSSCGGVVNGSQLSASTDGAYFVNGTKSFSMTVDNSQSHAKRYLAISAGTTATIDLVANSVTGFTAGHGATTRLIGDSATTTNDFTGDPTAAFGAHNQGNFVWSPLHNDQTNAASSLTSKQWYNGYYVSGLGATESTTAVQTYTTAN